MSNSLLSAIDNHNVANGDQSWFEGRMNATGEFVSDVGDALTKGAFSAVVAGVNSFIKSGVAVANFVGAGFEEPTSTYNLLKGFDDDLGRYYEKNKDGIEIAGFVAGSLVPGTAGIKALQAAKAGYIGKNISGSTGLMTSLTRDYATLAKVELASNTSPFSLMNTNVIKALSQGFGANALDAAAFEIAVAATMFKSPVLDEQGAGNLVNNILLGTIIGGGIGGLVTGIRIVYGIKKFAEGTDRELFKFKNLNELDDLATPELKLINYYETKLKFPKAELGETIVKSDLPAEKRLQLITEAREGSLERLDNLIRQEFIKYADNDPVIGALFFDKFKDIKSIQEVTAALINSKGAKRITANEILEVGDVLFPTHGIAAEEFSKILAKGEFKSLLVEEATKNTLGYRVVGDLAQLKVTGAREKIILADGTPFIHSNAKSAFADGYDMYRNLNGVVSVNPASEILQYSAIRRTPNNLIVDFERGGSVVDSAIPGLADLASKNKPIVVNRDIVLAGEINPIRIDAVNRSNTFNPTDMDDYLAVQARYIWAMEQKGMKFADRIVHENDLPLLEKAYHSGEDGVGMIVKMDDGGSPRLAGEALLSFIDKQKRAMTEALSDAGFSIEEISLRLNVTESWLKGESSDLFKLKPGDNYQTPRYARVDYPDNIHAMESYNAAYVDGAIQYEQQVAKVRMTHDQNFANYARDEAALFPDAPNMNEPGRIPTRAGAGANFVGAANSEYGSIGAWAQDVGSKTERLVIAKQTETAKQLNLAAAIITSPTLRAELDVVTNKLRSSADAWVFNPLNGQELIMRKEISFDKDGRVLFNKSTTTGPSEVIGLSVENAEFLKVHSSINANRQVHVKNLKSSAGVGDDVDLDVIYPPPINTVKYKHFVFIEPKGPTLGDKKTVITAKNEATLVKMIGEIDKNEYRIITKADSEEWHKALGDYEFALGINNSLVDSNLKRKGVLSDAFAGGNSDRILDDYLDWHMIQEKILATRMVEHKYSQTFHELQHLGAQYTNISTSQFRSLTDALVESVKDPYNDVVKTALNISRASEYKWWKGFNDTVKDAIEGPGYQLRQVFEKTKTIDDKFVNEVTTILDRNGMGLPVVNTFNALQTAGLNIADKPFLAQWISKAQALMSTTLLQWDFFNAVNNTISTPIMLAAETKFLLGAIQKGDPLIAGELAKLLTVAMPDGSKIVLPTVQKLMYRAVQNLHSDHAGTGELLMRYKQIGVITDDMQQMRSMLSELTIDFSKVTEGQAESALKRAHDFGRKVTGNRLAEESTRFLAADVARQITDLAIANGTLKNARQADEYIQMLVNKVQGNYLHSQRPIVFQGVVGQAVSLFQTYQFNLLQQLFKYVGDSDNKSVAMLLGLQGSIYGTQGLPAFNFINTHIVGNASGNTQHRDLYYASYSTFGKSLGDWMLYGAGANALGLIDPSLKTNIYSRGDINPRQVTVLPTQIEDIPVVAASVRFVSNLYRAIEKTGNGAALWPTISQAIEHNALSRPLAGLAQLAQGYTTTNQGSLLSSSQDLMNIAQSSRVFGGKPFDEAIALDALYRVNAYRAKDLSRIQALGSAVKTTLIGGGNPTEQEVTDFIKDYAKAGGKIDNFNRFMTNTMMSANRSQVNKLAQNLKSPFAQQMQIVMGGTPLEDFLNTPAAPQ